MPKQEKFIRVELNDDSPILTEEVTAAFAESIGWTLEEFYSAPNVNTSFEEADRYIKMQRKLFWESEKEWFCIENDVYVVKDNAHAELLEGYKNFLREREKHRYQLFEEWRKMI